jgi:hypothetical protein
MPLVVTLEGEPVANGSTLVVAKESTLFATVDNVPKCWEPHQLRVECTVDDRPRDPEDLSPLGFRFKIPKASFWKPARVQVLLRDERGGDTNLGHLAFDAVSAWARRIQVASGFALLLFIFYFGIVVPNVAENLKAIAGVSFGALTLTAVLVEPLRNWILGSLRQPRFGLPIGVVCLALSGYLGCTTVLLNRTAEVIELERPGDIALLEPGKWRLVIPWVQGWQQKARQGYCEWRTDSKECNAMIGVPDLPLWFWPFRKTVYGCQMLQRKEEEPVAANGALLEAWKKSKTCRPATLQWKPNSLADALVNADKPTTATALEELRNRNDESTLECQPANDNTCVLPVLGADGVFQQFQAAGTEKKSVIDLRLTSKGKITELLVKQVHSSQWLLLPLLLPPHERGGWVQADSEVGGRKLGQSLFYLRSPQQGPAIQEGQCWLLGSGAHLEKLVLRGNGSDVATFLATEPASVTTIPMCWQTDTKDGAGEMSDVEIYLDANWSPHADWRLDMPATWQPSRVRIYWAAKGYWGGIERTGNSSSQGVSTDASASRGLSVYLQEVEGFASVPRGSLAELHTIDAPAWKWKSQLTIPEWLWSLGDAEAASTWRSTKNPNVTVACDAAKQDHGSKPKEARCRAIPSPLPCYFLPGGTPISKKQCEAKELKLEPATREEAEELEKYTTRRCSDLQICRRQGERK